MDCLKFLFLLSLTISCANPVKKAVNKARYSAYEAVGMEKRDLFKREVKKVKNEQDDTGEAFKDALTELKEISKFDGGALEKQHGRLKDAYEEAKEEAADVSGRINRLDEVANDLFEEWEKEREQIQSSDLRRKSSRQLSQTKERYLELEEHLRRSEAKMKPVLTRLNDQVLFLKHNLNAKAIAGLKAESNKIENEVEKLIRDVNKSSQEAEKFIESL